MSSASSKTGSPARFTSRMATAGEGEASKKSMAREKAHHGAHDFAAEIGQHVLQIERDQSFVLDDENADIGKGRRRVHPSLFSVFS